MTFKVQVGPAQIAIHHGRTVLVCEPDGTIHNPGEKGLYFNDTRLISSWSLYADGVSWDLLSGGATSHDTLRIHLTNRALKTPGGAIPGVSRLMAADMWSGWVIRTLSADHPSYKPYSYQNGSVWPHDNAITALGFRRYGFAAEAGRIARDLNEAASHFNLNQMPELYAGLPRTASGFPVQYVGANIPQAWAAGSVFMTLHAMIGLQPDAPGGTMGLDPILPPWMPDLTLLGLRLGSNSFDIQFRRTEAGTTFEVLRGDPAAVVRHAVPPHRIHDKPALAGVV